MKKESSADSDTQFSMKTFNRQEVYDACMEYFDNDSLAVEVFMNKYILKNSDGKFFEKTPLDMHRRIAKEFARIEKNYDNSLTEDEIFKLLDKFQYINPQGSPMSAIGDDSKFQSLSNCFVIDGPNDSYGGIMKTDQEQAQIMKRRGGVGFDISKLRPKGIKTANAAITTDGIEVFMKRFSNTCEEVAQGGRRGALMQTISCYFPQIQDFIKIKRDNKSISGANISVRFDDDFMNAVCNNETVTLRWPVDSDNPSIKFDISSNEIWNEFIKSNWICSDPGAQFIDNVRRFTPSEEFGFKGHRSCSSNPCLTGDTRVAVADGRGFVTIEELAASGDDVPVYSYENSTGNVVIKTMRNPRLTLENAHVYEVTIEGGHKFKATGNHKMILRDGSRKRVDELAEGDQLQVAKRVERTLVEIGSKKRTCNSNHYVVIENSKMKKAEHKMIWEYQNCRSVPKGYVIHHIDFNSKNNTIQNLLLMEYNAHHRFHSDRMKGENNPIFKIKADSKRFAEYSKKMSQAVSGKNNPRAMQVTSQEIIQHATELTKKLGRRVSIIEWSKYAKDNKLPAGFSKWRISELGSVKEFLSFVAKNLGIENLESDPRLQETYKKAKENGYKCKVVNNEVLVARNCEWCGEEYWNVWQRREIAFCSHSCSNFYTNRIKGNNKKRAETLQRMHTVRAEKKNEEQLNIFTKLRFELGRNPKQTEWVKACKESNVVYRLGTKNGFDGWEDLKEKSQLHNHRVISVVDAGYENVYNGTVDDEHNFYIGLWNDKNNEQIMISTSNCGEQNLPMYESCRLLLLNMFSYVNDPYTNKATFDKELFRKHTIIAQKLLDDLIDLEIEAIDRILKKIESDPESDDEKKVERDLWKRIRSMGLSSRRTGLGVTGIADVIAAHGIKYGSNQSIELVENLVKHFALAAHEASVILAKERGAFPDFEPGVFEKNEFFTRLMENSSNEVNEMYLKFGRRNICTTTIAPAGSTSMMAQVSSGVEPIISIEGKRRRRINSNDVNARIDEVDEKGDKWQYYTIKHRGHNLWKKKNTNLDESKSPYNGSTLADVDPLSQVKILAAAQKWIENSISKTVNLPETATEEQINDIYIAAWKMGCKGITVFRYGSKKGIIFDKDSSIDDKQIKFVTNVAPQRPKSLPCDIHSTTVKGEKWTMFIGIMDDRPYEVFGGLSKYIEIPRKITKGNLIRNGKKNGIITYNLSFGDDDDLTLIKDIISVFDNPTYGSLTRVISLSLRHGAPIQYVVEQLQKDKYSDMTSFSRVVARVLKSYIPDGSIGGPQCEKCGGTLVYSSGCQQCQLCGSSHCL